MGYRSDVRFVVAVPSEVGRNELMALYCMNPLVQECNMAEHWIPKEVNVKDRTKYVDAPKHDPHNYVREYPVYLLVYEDNEVKWYEDYDDVKAVMHMREIIKMLGESKDSKFCYAYRFLRIGEETADIEDEVGGSQEDTAGWYDETSEAMVDLLESIMFIHREIILDIEQIEAQ